MPQSSPHEQRGCAPAAVRAVLDRHFIAVKVDSMRDLLSRTEAGDVEAKRNVLFTLDQEAKLIDPVWGGIYQYSAARDWDHAHFEKLMTFQAPALEHHAAFTG